MRGETSQKEGEEGGEGMEAGVQCNICRQTAGLSG